LKGLAGVAAAPLAAARTFSRETRAEGLAGRGAGLESTLVLLTGNGQLPACGRVHRACRMGTALKAEALATP
jgi:hypothetical protein